MTEPLYRPMPQTDPLRPPGAQPLAGGPLWFATAMLHRRGEPPRLVAAETLPADVLARLRAPRAPVCGLALDRPRLMGIVNVTPDSFSDGGRYFATDAALGQAHALLAEGADLLDIGGESTRPGAAPVSQAEEIDRVLPVIEALRAGGVDAPISIDTRKASVARAAFAVGADFLNDVSALGEDQESLRLAASTPHPVCLMHAQGPPETMQDAPAYADVLLDVYDHFQRRIAAAEAIGLPRARILLDPGLGFGKTLAHNLRLVRGLALYHGLGCALMLGASRKRFIGTISGVGAAADRAPGSIAVGLEALRQGAQMLRVHDVAETRQAVRVWQALTGPPSDWE